MRRLPIGALVLLIAVLVTVIAPKVTSPGLVGRGIPAAYPEPPQIGDCLTRETFVVSCESPHRWEVTTRWEALDPARGSQATATTCDQQAISYKNLAAVSSSGRWTLTTAVITTVLNAPADQRAGPFGWSICAIQPGWVDVRTGALGTIQQPSDAPELFGICLDYASGSGGVDCHDIHDIQLLATTMPSSVADGEVEAAVAAQPACHHLAAVLMSTQDPTYGGQLELRVAAAPSTSASAQPTYTLRCFAVASDGRLLNGSLTSLGDRPVPFA